ncbi:MAG: hypothetical protein HRT52_08840 [Colwellia sp.]|nr:hypothetical protein [Colwellia sp.]
MSDYSQVLIVYMLFNIPTAFFHLLLMSAQKELKEIIEMKSSTSLKPEEGYDFSNMESIHLKKITQLRRQSFWLANIFCLIALIAILSQ